MIHYIIVASFYGAITSLICILFIDLLIHIFFYIYDKVFTNNSEKTKGNKFNVMFEHRYSGEKDDVIVSNVNTPLYTPEVPFINSINNNWAKHDVPPEKRNLIDSPIIKEEDNTIGSDCQIDSDKILDEILEENDGDKK